MKRTLHGKHLTVLFAMVALLALPSLAFAAGKTETPVAAENSTKTEGPVKLNLAVQTNPNVQDFLTNKWTKYIEKGANVTLDFTYLPVQNADAKAKLSLMVAGGTTLPDVFCLGGAVIDEAMASVYASKGIIIKLNDYYKDASLTTNYQQLPQSAKDRINRDLKLPDGNLYSVPNMGTEPWNEGPYRAWINSEWLNKLNLKAPTTTTELYDTLKAFVEKDPNGNGKKDEVGMVGSTNGWAQNPMVFLMNSFIYANPDKSYFGVKDGKIFASFIQPEWKQGLEYMNKLIKEGLLSPLSFTQDQTQMKSLINKKEGMAGIIPSGSYSAFDIKELEYKMVLLAPIKGPSGTATTPRNPSMPQGHWYITKDCKNPKTAFKLADFMLSEEAGMFSRYGVKGVSWTDDPAVVPLYESNAGMGNRKIVILNTSWWSNPQNDSWQARNPRYSEPFVEGTFLLSDTTSKRAPNQNIVYSEMYPPFYPKELIYKLPLNEQDIKSIADKKAAVDKYVMDISLQFAFGNKPFTEWDNYINELNKMGLNDYISIYQKAYDSTK